MFRLFRYGSTSTSPPLIFATDYYERLHHFGITLTLVSSWYRDIILDKGKGVPSFDEMMDIALVEVDFDDLTTNVRGRRALAIAKPTPRGY